MVQSMVTGEIERKRIFDLKSERISIWKKDTIGVVDMGQEEEDFDLLIVILSLATLVLLLLFVVLIKITRQ